MAKPQTSLRARTSRARGLARRSPTRVADNVLVIRQPSRPLSDDRDHLFTKRGRRPDDVQSLHLAHVWSDVACAVTHCQAERIALQLVHPHRRGGFWVERYGVRESSEVVVVEDPGRTDSAPAAAIREEPLPERIEPASERETLRAEVHRLETELERYRAHAERTSKLFLSATNYAEWVRENARRDAELTLRKAKAKARQLEERAAQLERTERALVHSQTELARLQAVTEETRARLSAFLAAGLQALDAAGAATHGDDPEPTHADLQDTLHRQVASTSEPVQARRADVERPEG